MRLLLVLVVQVTYTLSITETSRIKTVEQKMRLFLVLVVQMTYTLFITATSRIKTVEL